MPANWISRRTRPCDFFSAGTDFHRTGTRSPHSETMAASPQPGIGRNPSSTRWTRRFVCAPKPSAFKKISAAPSVIWIGQVMTRWGGCASRFRQPARLSGRNAWSHPKRSLGQEATRTPLLSTDRQIEYHYSVRSPWLIRPWPCTRPGEIPTIPPIGSRAAMNGKSGIGS